MIWSFKTIQVLELGNNSILLHEFSFSKGEVNAGVLSQFSSIEECLTAMQSKNNVVVFLNDKNVLFKSSEIVNKETDLAVLFKDELSLSTNDFYSDFYQTNTQKAFCSLVRKEVVDDLLEKLKDLKVDPLGTIIHPFSLVLFKEFVKDSVIETPNRKISFDEDIKEIGKISSKEERNYFLGDYKVTDKEIISLSIAYEYFTTKGFITKGSISTIQQNLNSQAQNNRLFSLIKWGGLSVLLLISLISTLLYMSYFDKYQESKSKNEFSSQQLTKTKDLRKSVKQKELLIAKMNSLQSSEVSNLVDTLMLVKPVSIVLTKLSYQPVVGKLESEKKIALVTNFISVEGSSSNSLEINNWVDKIYNFQQVKEVVIENYKELSKQSNFTMNILLNETE